MMATRSARSRALLAPALTLVVLVAGLTAHAPAAEPESGTLRPGGTVVWDGAFDYPAALTPDSSVKCVAGECDVFTLHVALGPHHWLSRDGAVEVTIRMINPYDGETDIDLFVYDETGAEIARSAAVDSNAESVFLPSLPDGEYQVAVALSHGLEPPVAYKGVAQVEYARNDGDGAPLLPNLVALKPSNFHIATAGGLLPEPENPLISCYPEETIEDEAHPTRCLRFNQIIANVGEGPLELRLNLPEAATATGEEDERIVQRVHHDDGTTTDHLVDKYEFHAAHGHVHYSGFGRSFLYPCTWTAGTPDCGDEPATSGKKVGFCVIDVMLLDEWFGQPGNGPRTWTFPTCNIPTEGEWMVQGIDVGWADVYGWNLPDQYLDITHVKDGLYELEQVANPKGIDGEPDAVIEGVVGGGDPYADNRASEFICLLEREAYAVSTQAEADACLAAARP